MNNDWEIEKKRFHRLLSQAQIGWWEADLNKREYRYPQELAELLGFSATTISFDEFHKLIIPKHRQILVHGMDGLKKTGNLEQKFPIRLPHQKSLWVNLSLSLADDNGQEGSLAEGYLQLIQEKAEISLLNRHLRNISNEDSESDEKHIRNAKLLSDIYNKLPIGIELYDKDGNLLDINDRDLAIFGLGSKENALGLNMFDNPNLPAEVIKALRKGKNINFRIKYNFSLLKAIIKTSRSGYKDIAARYLVLRNAQKEITGYLATIIDNTDRELVLTRIRDFENVFKMIADYAKVGYAKLNPITKTGYAVDQWFKNYGEYETTDLRKVVGTYNKVYAEDQEKILEFYKGILDGSQKAFKGEVRIIQPDGSLKWIRSHIMVSLYDPSNNEIELIGVNYDISGLKEIETQLTLAKDKAETMDRLKSAFLANMSHEIRTPLNAIVGFSRLLQENMPEDERRQYMEIVEENNELLLQLISDILDLSKIEAGTFEFVPGDVDCDQLCQDIVQGIQIKVPQNIDLIFDNLHSQCRLNSDKNRLHQVISNFINNALKFTHQGSIHVGYVVKEHELEFYVKDTGTGIPPDKLSSIFERFVKLNNLAQGTGLGLSICKSIVEQFGGKIGVESEEGVGSKFWFTHPYKLEKGEISPKVDKLANLPPKASLAVSPHAKPMLLVAEDTDSNYLLISTILKKEYELHRAKDGIEAVELCKTLQPDLILMDIRMPRLDGIKATKEIRKFNTTTPIFAVTAFAYDKDKQYALEAGCNAFITKPISSMELKNALNEWINK